MKSLEDSWKCTFRSTWVAMVTICACWKTTFSSLRSAGISGEAVGSKSSLDQLWTMCFNVVLAEARPVIGCF